MQMSDKRQSKRSQTIEITYKRGGQNSPLWTLLPALGGKSDKIVYKLKLLSIVASFVKKLDAIL